MGIKHCHMNGAKYPPMNCIEYDDAKTSLGLPKSTSPACGIGFELTAFYG